MDNVRRLRVNRFDFSGTITDVVEAKRLAFSHVLGWDIPYYRIKEGSFKHLLSRSRRRTALDLLYRTEQFFSWFKPFDGAREVLQELRNEGHRNGIVSRAEGITTDFLDEWFRRNQIPIDKNEIETNQPDKTASYATADVIVDDTYDHVRPFAGSDKKVFLFRHPTRAEGPHPQDVQVKVVRSWRELGGLICMTPPVFEAA